MEVTIYAVYDLKLYIFAVMVLMKHLESLLGV